MAAVAAAPLTAERLAGLREELAEVSPDAFQPQIIPSASCLAPLREELRRLKFVFTEADAQRRFVASALAGNLTAEEPPTAHGSGWGDGERGRKEAKERLKAIKRSIALEEEVHAQVQRDISEAHIRVRQLHEQCALDLQEAETEGAANDSDADLDLNTEAVADEHRQAAMDAGQATEDVSNIRLACQKEAAKRRRLEEELRRLEAKSRAHQDTTAKLRRDEAAGRLLDRNFEALQQAECRLGLPSINFDDTGGLVVLEGGPPAGDGPLGEAARAIEVSFDEDGRLLRASPHPVLGLQEASKAAVAEDDIGKLVTLAWDKICEAAQPEEVERRREQRHRISAGRGGA